MYGSNHIFLPRAFSRCSRLWLLHPIKRWKQTNAAFSKKVVPKKVPMPAMSRLASVTSLFNNVKCSNFFFLFYCKLKEKYPIRRKINSKKKYLYVKSALLFLGFPKNRFGLACATKNRVFFKQKSIGSFCKVLDIVCLKKTVHLFCLGIKWLWVRVLLVSLKLRMLSQFWARRALTFRQLLSLDSL